MSGTSHTVTKGAVIAPTAVVVSRATGGSLTSLEDTSQDWPIDFWEGDRVYIDSGQGAGQTRDIDGNERTSLRISGKVPWVTAPNATSRYRILSARTTLTVTSGAAAAGGAAASGSLAGLLEQLLLELREQNTFQLATKTVNIDGTVRVEGKAHVTDQILIPGIGTGAAYLANDALGTRFTFENVPEFGFIQTAKYFDLDDEGLAVDLVIHSQAFTATADNSPYDVSDLDSLSIIDTIVFATGDFVDFVTSQVAFARGRGHLYHAPEKRLYCQMIARGAVDIAAGAQPRVQLGIVLI